MEAGATPHAEDITQMAVSIFEKVKEIKKRNPAVARTIDQLEAEIRERLVEIQKQIGKLERRDRDLVKILVINGLHRTADEVLIDHP
jgi:ribosomal protein L18E